MGELEKGGRLMRSMDATFHNLPPMIPVYQVEYQGIYRLSTLDFVIHKAIRR